MFLNKMSNNQESFTDSPTLCNLDDRLVSFLRNLATSMERKQLQPEQLGRIGEFFMSYHFWEQADKDNEQEDSEEDISKEEFLKFLFLGYYVYRVILKDQHL